MARRWRVSQLRYCVALHSRPGKWEWELTCYALCFPPCLAQTGSKEDKPCSGRGLCDVATGLCHCYTGYVTSDGRGKGVEGNGYRVVTATGSHTSCHVYNARTGEIGDRGDCGHANEAITSCPGATECSGHGVCSDHPFYLCTCAEGWMGGDCNERTCVPSCTPCARCEWVLLQLTRPSNGS